MNAPQFREKNSVLGSVRAVIALLLLACTTRVLGDPPDSKPAASQSAPIHVDAAHLCGRLDQQNGFNVLYLWGTPQERGVAQGYLLASEIHAMLTEYLDDRALSGGPTVYQSV